MSKEKGGKVALLESEYFAAVAAHATALHDEQLKLLDVPKLTARGFPARLWEINGHTSQLSRSAAMGAIFDARRAGT